MWSWGSGRKQIVLELHIQVKSKHKDMRQWIQVKSPLPSFHNSHAHEKRPLQRLHEVTSSRCKMLLSVSFHQYYSVQMLLYSLCSHVFFSHLSQILCLKVATYKENFFTTQLMSSDSFSRHSIYGYIYSFSRCGINDVQSKLQEIKENTLRISVFTQFHFTQVPQKICTWKIWKVNLVVSSLTRCGGVCLSAHWYPSFLSLILVLGYVFSFFCI